MVRGILVQIHKYDGCEQARDIGLTAGRWNSLAAHYFGVYVCFGVYILLIPLKAWTVWAWFDFVRSFGAVWYWLVDIFISYFLMSHLAPVTAFKYVIFRWEAAIANICYFNVLGGWICNHLHVGQILPMRLD